MTPGQRRRVMILAAGLCLAPFASAASVGSLCAGRLARAIAEPLVEAGDSMAEWSATKAPEELTPTSDAAAIAALDGGDRAPGSRLQAPGQKEKEKAMALPKPVGVFVSRARVLAAANAGIRPSGAPVPATWWRPAGLALAGVAYLGVGLRDGDVLVSPGASEGAIIGAVSAALRHHARGVSGVAWRGTQKIFITVELPELDDDPAPASEPGARSPEPEAPSELARLEQSATLAKR